MDWRISNRNGVPGYVCLHGIFHPDKKTILAMNGFDQSRCEKSLEHICDGCCNMEEFPGYLHLDNFKKEFEIEE